VCLFLLKDTCDASGWGPCLRIIPVLFRYLILDQDIFVSNGLGTVYVWCCSVQWYPTCLNHSSSLAQVHSINLVKCYDFVYKRRLTQSTNTLNPRCRVIVNRSKHEFPWRLSSLTLYRRESDPPQVGFCHIWSKQTVYSSTSIWLGLYPQLNHSLHMTTSKTWSRDGVKNVTMSLTRARSLDAH
jgi:hypothetical protein